MFLANTSWDSSQVTKLRRGGPGFVNDFVIEFSSKISHFSHNVLAQICPYSQLCYTEFKLIWHKSKHNLLTFLNLQTVMLAIVKLLNFFGYGWEGLWPWSLITWSGGGGLRHYFSSRGAGMGAVGYQNFDFVNDPITPLQLHSFLKGCYVTLQFVPIMQMDATRYIHNAHCSYFNPVPFYYGHNEMKLRHMTQSWELNDPFH